MRGQCISRGNMLTDGQMVFALASGKVGWGKGRKCFPSVARPRRTRAFQFKSLIFWKKCSMHARSQYLVLVCHQCAIELNKPEWSLVKRSNCGFIAKFSETRLATRAIKKPFWKVTFGLLAAKCGHQSSNCRQRRHFYNGSTPDSSVKMRPFHQHLICETTVQCGTVGAKTTL